MQWSKVLIAGAVGGVVNAVYGFVMHALIMGNTYSRYAPEVFRQDGSGMAWFITLPIVLGLVGAAFFAKSRSAWAAGPKGGAMFGFWVGLIGFIANFYTPLIYTGYPYYLTWCTGSILLIGWVVVGAVIGAMYKTT
jgi:hypothetical protein